MGNTFPGFENFVTSQGSAHARIHQGTFYSADLFDPALASAGVLDMLIRPDASVSMHLRFTLAAGGDAQVELFEAATFSAAGALLQPINRNRITANVARGLLNTGPTITAPGVKLTHGLLPGGSQGQTVGAVGSSFEEWVLAPGVVYLLRSTNLAGQAQPVDIQVDFYEPIGKLR